MIEALIIADDLSGAADCAVACVAAGAATLVILDPKADPGPATAVAVDVNSRTMAAQEAGAAAAEATLHLYGESTRILYQKMDSTLRGHWVPELLGIRKAAAAILRHTPMAIVAPAFPVIGRATIDGRVFVNGTPLEDTEVWKQAGLTGSADIRALLTEAGLKVRLAGLALVALGPEALVAQLVRWRDDGCDAVVCDARIEDDLAAIAAASLVLPEKPLWVGSGGLMRALVRAGEGESAPSCVPERTAKKPILVVVGSASGASRMQFDALAAGQGIASVTIPPSALREGADPEQVQAHVQALDRAFASGFDLAVAIGGEAIDLQEGPQLAAALAELIAPRLPHVGGLVVTGGETARALLVRAGITVLRMRGEIEAGVPVGSSMGRIAIPVITKAGAFGDRATLVRCRAALRGDGSDPPYPATDE